jgi:hypothetical protein
MYFYFLLSSLWLLLALLLASVLCLDRDLLTVAREIGSGWGLVLGALIFVSVSLATSPYWGLEYEDAFEYEYAARLFAHSNIHERPQLNPICLDGTLEDCRATASLSHPSGVAVLGSWLVRLGKRLSGEHGAVPSLSLVTLILTTVALALFTQFATSDRFSTLLAVVSLLATVEFTLHFGTGFAEPFSGFLIFLTATTAWRLLEGPQPTRRLLVAASGLISVAVALAILCKREAFILTAIVPALSAWSWWERRSSGPSRSLAPWPAGAAFLGLMLALALGGADLISAEAASPVQRWPFSASNFRSLAPQYLVYLFSSPAVSCLGALIACALCWGQRRLLFFGFSFLLPLGLLFTTFDHDYYTVVYEEVPRLHFERYTLQLAPFLAHVAGIGGGRLVNKVFADRGLPRVASRSVVSLALLAIVGWSAWRLWVERVERHNEEVEIRLRPARMACTLVEGDGAILTPQPVVMGVACASRQQTLDLNSLGRWIDVADIKERILQGEKIYMLELPTTQHDIEERHPESRAGPRSPELCRCLQVSERHRWLPPSEASSPSVFRTDYSWGLGW